MTVCDGERLQCGGYQKYVNYNLNSLQEYRYKSNAIQLLQLYFTWITWGYLICISPHAKTHWV